jgi:hypothetical protein
MLRRARAEGGGGARTGVQTPDSRDQTPESLCGRAAAGACIAGGGEVRIALYLNYFDHYL